MFCCLFLIIFAIMYKYETTKISFTFKWTMSHAVKLSAYADLNSHTKLKCFRSPFYTLLAYFTKDLVFPLFLSYLFIEQLIICQNSKLDHFQMILCWIKKIKICFECENASTLLNFLFMIHQCWLSAHECMFL